MIVRVVAKPGRRKERLTWTGTELVAEVTARAHDGAANAAIIALVAQALKIPKSTTRITRGATARTKTLEIDADEARIRHALEALPRNP